MAERGAGLTGENSSNEVPVARQMRPPDCEDARVDRMKSRPDPDVDLAWREAET
jgi:hypothetical protein